MNKKELIIPLLVIGLTLLFAGVCVAVFLTNGKSKKWVARKIKIGGLLLTLTAASCNGGGGEVMCYSAVAHNYISFENIKEDNILEIMLDTGNVLKGHITGAQDSIYSYKVYTDKENIIQQGELIPVDGKFESLDESFKIELDENIMPGGYILDLFPSSVETQDDTYLIAQVNLLVKEE